jgi:hypothetical protein
MKSKFSKVAKEYYVDASIDDFLIPNVFPKNENEYLYINPDTFIKIVLYAPRKK